MSNTTELVVFIIYLLCMVGIGLFFFLRLPLGILISGFCRLILICSF